MIRITFPDGNESKVDSVTVLDGNNAVAVLNDGEDMHSWRQTLSAKEASKLAFHLDGEEDVIISNVSKVKPNGRDSFHIYNEKGRYTFRHTLLGI